MAGVEPRGKKRRESSDTEIFAVEAMILLTPDLTRHIAEELNAMANIEEARPKEPVQTLRTLQMLEAPPELDIQFNLRNSLESEMRQMKQQTEICFKNEIKNLPSDGYRCMWQQTCGRVIKGRGNFKKHLEWHLNRTLESWNRLIEDHSEWLAMKKNLVSKREKVDESKEDYNYKPHCCN